MKAPRIKIVRACLSKVNEPSSGEDVENYKSIIGVLVAPYTTSDMVRLLSSDHSI